MSKKIKRVLILWAVMIFIGAAFFAVTGGLLPYWHAKNTMPDNGTMMLTQQPDGSTLITWPWGINAQYHVLEIVEADNAGTPEKVLYSTEVFGESSSILPALPTEEPITIRVRSAHRYRRPFGETPQVRYGEKAMEITGVFTPPAIENLRWVTNTEEKTVELQFDIPPQSTCRVCYEEPTGGMRNVRTLTTGALTLDFGGDQGFPMPEWGSSHTFTFFTDYEGDGYVYRGGESGRVTIRREDLLGTKLHLNCTEEGNNVYTLSWNETRGEQYVLEQYDEASNDWTALCRVSQGEPRSYTTGHLERYKNHRFRVTALGTQTLPDSTYAAEPDEVRVSTGASVVYSTVWPIQDLAVYADPERGEVIATAPGAQAYCVLDLKDGMFYVRHGDQYGWIDSNYCMINLPDMIGDICLYDMVNSYDSLYMVHEYEIPTVTGETIPGYEKVLTDDQEFLVPLLYPTALKLEKAAFDAMAQGYKIKIYDSFRPKETTKFLYDTASKLMKTTIPEKTYTDKILEDLPQLPEGNALTYEMLMTDSGRYTLDYFLASTGSRHNQGIAMDLTIVRREDGTELPMQTSMHDLSWYSEKSRNNAYANTLSQIMNDAGFGGLLSEWWHFQDNDAKDALNPEYLWDGVTSRCWVADDHGWRYRKAEGSYMTDCTEYIDDVLYTFDKDGYVQ